MFKFYLNGTEIADHPDGWDNISSTVKRDEFSGGLLYDADIKLMSYGGHDLFISLQNLWNTDRFGSSTFDVYQRSGTVGYVLIHAGTIFHSDLKWKLINNAVEFKVEDSSWFAKINNNRKIETSIDVTKSKNQVNIAPCPSFNLTMHKVVNGADHGAYRVAYRVYDVFKYLIDWMSDGKIAFESATFDSGGIYDDYCIVSGPELYDYQHNIPPRLSFYKFYESLKKIFNLQLSINGALNSPIIQIENAEYFWDGAMAFTLLDTPEEVTVGVNTAKLYSNVNVGSGKYETTSSLIFPDVQSMISFRDESFYFQIVDNVDATLDLKHELVTSNASIDVCLEQYSGYDNYSEDTFLIKYITATNKTYQSDWANTGHHLYNETLNNINILSRWTNSFPGDLIANFNNVNDNRSEAHRTSAADGYSTATQHADGYIGTDGPFAFNDDYTLGFDPSLNYGAATAQGTNVNIANSIYTAPADGNYTFTASMRVIITSYVNALISGNAYPKTVSLHFKKFDAGNNEIDDFICSGQTFYNAIFNYVAGTWNTYLNTGEYVAVYLHFKYNSVPTNPGNYFYTYTVADGVFACIGVDTGFISIRVPGGNGYKALRLTFKYPLTLEEYNTIRASKSGLISVPLLNNSSVQGWVENVKFEHISGETAFTLITDGNTIYR